MINTKRNQKSQWYVVPPYKNEGWKVLNEAGELVATFEDKHECLGTIMLRNRHLGCPNDTIYYNPKLIEKQAK